MLIAYLHGVASMGCAVIALFFARYHRLTKDELFVWFCLAFTAFAVTWTVLAFGRHSEVAHLIYGLRLLGFALLAIGILRKNRPPAA